MEVIFLADTFLFQPNIWTGEDTGSIIRYKSISSITTSNTSTTSNKLTDIILMEGIIDVVVLMNHGLLYTVFLNSIWQLQLQIGVSQHNLELG